MHKIVTFYCNSYLRNLKPSQLVNKRIAGFVRLNPCAELCSVEVGAQPSGGMSGARAW